MHRKIKNCVRFKRLNTEYIKKTKPIHATLWIHLQKCEVFLFLSEFSLIYGYNVCPVIEQEKIESKEKNTHLKKTYFFVDLLGFSVFFAGKNQPNGTKFEYNNKYRVRRKYFVFSIEHQYCFLYFFLLVFHSRKLFFR